MTQDISYRPTLTPTAALAVAPAAELAKPALTPTVAAPAPTPERPKLTPSVSAAAAPANPLPTPVPSPAPIPAPTPAVCSIDDLPELQPLPNNNPSSEFNLADLPVTPRTFMVAENLPYYAGEPVIFEGKLYIVTYLVTDLTQVSTPGTRNLFLAPMTDIPEWHIHHKSYRNTYVALNNIVYRVDMPVDGYVKSHPLFGLRFEPICPVYDLKTLDPKPVTTLRHVDLEGLIRSHDTVKLADTVPDRHYPAAVPVKIDGKYGLYVYRVQGANDVKTCVTSCRDFVIEFLGHNFDTQGPIVPIVLGRTILKQGTVYSYNGRNWKWHGANQTSYQAGEEFLPSPYNPYYGWEHQPQPFDQETGLCKVVPRLSSISPGFFFNGEGEFTPPSDNADHLARIDRLRQIAETLAAKGVSALSHLTT